MSDRLNHYLNLWDLTDPQHLATTFSSHVYTVIYQGTRVVLKMLRPAGEEEKTGAIALRCFNGHGAVQLLRSDEEGMLLEYADGENLIGLVKSGQDGQATEIIAGVLNKLHTANSSAAGLPLLQDWFGDLYKKADEDQRRGVNSIYVRAAPIARVVLANPRDQHVLHGDIHHENVRHSSRGWVAFDPKGLIGERAYDAANTLCNPVDMPDIVLNEARLLRNAAILSHHMKIDLSRILTFTFIYTCLSASWYLGGGADSQDAKNAVRLGEIIEPHLPTAFS